MSKKLQQAKEAMLNYEDFYGGDLLRIGDVNKCTTIEELSDILKDHESHMESMLLDAKNHLGELRNKYGIFRY